METLHQTIPNMFQKHPKDVNGVMIKNSSINYLEIKLIFFVFDAREKIS